MSQKSLWSDIFWVKQTLDKKMLVDNFFSVDQFWTPNKFRSKNCGSGDPIFSHMSSTSTNYLVYPNCCTDSAGRDIPPPHLMLALWDPIPP